MLSRPVQSNLNPAPGPLVPLAPTSSRTLELNISLEHVFSETKVFNKKYTLVELYKDFVSYGLSVVKWKRAVFLLLQNQRFPIPNHQAEPK